MVHPVDSSVVVSVPPQADFLRLLRSVTGSVAGQLRLSVDDIEDLRLAVDEAFSFLLTLGTSASAVVTSLLPSPEELIATVSIDVPITPWPPDGMEDTLSWKVISGLVDRAALQRSAQGHPAIVMVKRTLDALGP